MRSLVLHSSCTGADIGPNATMEDGRIPVDVTLTVVTRLGTADVAGILRRVAASAGGDVAIGDVRTMTSVVGDAVAAPAATASLLVTMAGLALVLGSIGVTAGGRLAAGRRYLFAGTFPASTGLRSNFP
jgi:hypothetical protein